MNIDFSKIEFIILAAVVAAVVLVGIVLAIVLPIRKKRKKTAASASPEVEQTPQETVKEPVEEAVEESVEEPVKAEPVKEEHVPEPPAESKPEVVETEERDEEVSEGDAADDEVTQVTPVVENGKTRFIVIKYSKSFLARLIQSDEQTKRYYSELKNKLLLYGGVKNRITWKYESFRKGRKTLAKLRVRGKTLSVTLALDPYKYTDTEYRVESLEEVKSYATTPCLYRIKNNRRLMYAKELIEELATENDLIENADAEHIDYAPQHPYEETDALIARKLIKVLTDEDAQSGTTFKPSEVRESVTAKEVDTLMKDEVAASLIVKTDGKIDKTKQGIINIDLLSQYFESGETVTLDEVKKRVKGFDRRTTYLKVLARGTLNKPLIVEADSFSLQAVKMIVLTGGKAIKNSK